MKNVGDLLVEFKEAKAKDDEPPVLTLTERNGFVLQSERFNKRLATDDTSKYKLVRRQDIAFNPYLLWAGAVAQNTIVDAGVISPLYPTFRVREGHDPRYVARLLLTPQMISAYDRIAFGSVPRRRRSSVEDFLALEVPSLPALAEQRRIATVLDHADALRTKRRQLLLYLDSLTQSIFTEMFGDVRTNEYGYDVATVDDISERVTDGEHKTPRRSESGFPLLSARNVRDGWIDFDNTDFVDADEYALLSRRIEPREGDVLISCSGTIGRVAQVRQRNRFAMVRSAALVRPGVAVHPTFLECTLASQTLKSIMVAQANSSAQANLFQNQIKRLPVMVPPVDLQEEFAYRVARVAAVVEIARQAIAADDELFASLQSRAFRGDL